MRFAQQGACDSVVVRADRHRKLYYDGRSRQDLSIRYTGYLAKAGILLYVGSVADMYDDV